MSDTIKQQAKAIERARHKIVFRILSFVAEHADEPGSLPVQLDEFSKLLCGFIPSTAAEAEIEIDAIGHSLPSKNTGPSKLAALKEVTGKSDAMDAVCFAASELVRLQAIESAARTLLAAKKKVQGRKFSGSQFLEEAKHAEAEAEIALRTLLAGKEEA